MDIALGTEAVDEAVIRSKQIDLVPALRQIGTHGSDTAFGSSPMSLTTQSFSLRLQLASILGNLDQDPAPLKAALSECLEGYGKLFLETQRELRGITDTVEEARCMFQEETGKHRFQELELGLQYPSRDSDIAQSSITSIALKVEDSLHGLSTSLAMLGKTLHDLQCQFALIETSRNPYQVKAAHEALKVWLEHWCPARDGFRCGMESLRFLEDVRLPRTCTLSTASVLG
ncbi:hypothetical protein QFC20_004022 [Naganishia adeliensis]|uniref:Uncharacterized protein n=1 Tax=Naganishia adeliensis TaxID=92952 RepID=A0ACC2W742_9TREE|nr:hypothetical protein QFC20_004022 [Naganishia adeliensis]